MTDVVEDLLRGALPTEPRLALGIDVGATKIAGGLVDVTTGRVLSRAEVSTSAERGSLAVLEDCRAMAETLAGGQGATIGIGICEIVGTDGTIDSAATIQWKHPAVTAAFRAIGPVFIESDVRAAALAEARSGHGRGHASFLYVVAGTGLSCCLVDDGRPRRGNNGRAMLLGAPALEAEWSGGALMRRLGRHDLRPAITDDADGATIQQAAAHVGQHAAILVNALDVELVALGGGLGSDERYRQWVAAAMDADLWPGAPAVPVLTSALGRDGGIIGAAMAAADALGPTAARHEVEVHG